MLATTRSVHEESGLVGSTGLPFNERSAGFESRGLLGETCCTPPRRTVRRQRAGSNRPANEPREALHQRHSPVHRIRNVGVPRTISRGTQRSARRAGGMSLPSALDGMVAETAAGRLLPGVHRCLLRIETPRLLKGWTAAATTHQHDGDGLDGDVAFRIASVTKMVTATALLLACRSGSLPAGRSDRSLPPRGCR